LGPATYECLTIRALHFPDLFSAIMSLPELPWQKGYRWNLDITPKTLRFSL
jgi:hypothetical protein